MTPMQEIAPIQDVPMEVGVELDRRMLKIREILDLQVGSIIRMDRSAGENIDIYVGNRLVAFGEIVIIENTMGVRITDFRIEG
ncbi:MAG: surface presentation of antigen protein [Bryobacterales bacterium]|nr:surface presentation of antigen protein [Bryobacterales bacterium]